MPPPFFSGAAPRGGPGRNAVISSALGTAAVSALDLALPMSQHSTLHCRCLSTRPCTAAVSALDLALPLSQLAALCLLPSEPVFCLGTLPSPLIIIIIILILNDKIYRKRER